MNKYSKRYKRIFTEIQATEFTYSDKNEEFLLAKELGLEKDGHEDVWERSFNAGFSNVYKGDYIIHTIDGDVYCSREEFEKRFVLIEVRKTEQRPDTDVQRC